MALYPPTIEGQLPPAVLWTNESEEKVITITIPYEINRGVDPLAIVGYSIRIKNLISDKLLGVFNVFGYQHNNIVLEIKDELFISKVNLGDNFKIQVAFGEAVGVEGNQQVLTNLGYYSTVGICKYMNKPWLNIIPSGGGWRGEYISDQLDELLYSSQFILKDENKEVIEVGDVEIINYLNEEQEQFYEEYFEKVIKTQLTTIKELAAKDAEDFNKWKSTSQTLTAYNRLLSTSLEELKQPTGNNKEAGNKEIKALSIYQDGVVETLQEKVSNLHQLLQMKNYTEEVEEKKLLKTIAALKATYADNIVKINKIGAEQGYDESIKEALSKKIKVLDKSFNKLVGAIDTQDLSLNGSDKYWKVASDNNYSDYFEAVKKSSKSVFYRFKTQLKLGYKYYVDWHVETSSGYKEVISNKAIVSDEILAPDFSLVPKVRIDEINGIAEIAIENPENDNSEKNFGHWKILKATSKDNFGSWTEMYDIENCYSWYLSPPNSFKVILIKDYDIEHGISYQYALQQINDYGIRSIKIASPSVNAKFEDIYLCDETRQLRIAFNPKVSSMKNSILESKQNTIGGKYPYIFRNGNVLYKEFTISGMVSYLEDPNNEFKVDFKEFSEVNTTNLTNDNIAKERLFKMEVLDWLNNGKPKLLKTATEGNYVVTLMNVSLTPNDTLGRMLHSFNATAVEIQDKDTMVRADLKQLDNERIHIETCIGHSIITNQSDMEIKEIWIYGSTYLEQNPANVIINGKQYMIGGEGLRLETIDGEKITSYETKSKGVVADIYYTYKPILNKGAFSNTKEFEVKELIGRVHSGTDIETPGYYKILTATYHGAPVVDQNNEIRYTTYSDGFKFKDENRALYLHYPDHVETLYVVDQLTFSDVWLNKIYCGDNISLTYSKIYADTGTGGV